MGRSAAREAQFAEDAVVQALVAETTALIRVGARGEGFVSRNPCSVTKPDANDAGPTADDVSSLEASFTALFSEMGKKHARVSVAETESSIRESCVVAFAARELAGCAFMDMTARASYYASLLDVVDAVATLAGCANLLRRRRLEKFALGRGVAAGNAAAGARLPALHARRRGAGRGETETRRADERAETKRRDMSDKSDSEGDETRSAEWAKAAAAEISLARRILAVHDAVQAAADARKEAATAEDAAMEPSAPRGGRGGARGAPLRRRRSLFPAGAKKERDGYGSRFFR